LGYPRLFLEEVVVIRGIGHTLQSEPSMTPTFPPFQRVGFGHTKPPPLTHEPGPGSSEFYPRWLPSLHVPPF